MMIPNFIDVQVIDPKTGKFTAEWGTIFQQLFTQLQSNASDQGLVVGSQTQDDMIIIQNAIQPPGLPTDPITPIFPQGTLLFNTSTINGGVLAPNGQLYVKLQDNVFHPITNT